MSIKGLKPYPGTNEDGDKEVPGAMKWDWLKKVRTAVGRKESNLNVEHTHNFNNY